MEVQENSSTLEFQEYMIDLINKGSLSLMLSIGHRTGLFDTMVSLPSSTSKQIPLVSDLEDRLKKGINVLDIGCGNSRVMNMMANRFPLSRFTGYDISQEAIKNAQYKSLLTGNNNVDFTVKDVSKILDTQSKSIF